MVVENRVFSQNSESGGSPVKARSNGPLVKSDVPIHPSGWRALGKGSRGPNRRTLGRVAGSRAESAAAQQQARRSGRVTANGVWMGQGGGSPEL